MKLINIIKIYIDEIIAISIILICLSIFLVLETKRTQKGFSELHQEFYSISLNGSITYLNGSGGRSYFKINQGKKYFLTPHNTSDDQKSFYSFVNVGDRFIKPAFSDTVTIISQNQINKYTFKNYSSN